MQKFAAALWIWLFCVIASTSALAASVPPPLSIHAGVQEYSLGPYLSYRQDLAQSYLLDVHRQPPDSWGTPNSLPLHLGIDTTSWLKVHINVSDNAPHDWVLKLGWPNFSEVEWYLLDRRTGRLLNQQNPIQTMSDDRLSFPIRLPENGHYVLYLKVSGAEKVILPLTLKSPDLHAKETHLRSVLTGLFYGVLLAMLAYNLSLFIFTHEENYATYCLYVASIIFYTLCTSSNYLHFIHFDIDWVEEHTYRFSVPIAFLSASIFLRKFLSLENHKGMVLQLSNLAISSWLLLLISAFAIPADWYIWIIDIAAVISCPIGIWISSCVWYKGDPSGKYITIAWSPLLIATFVLMMGLTDIIPFSMDLYYLQNVAFTIEVLLLSMALAERINRERLEKAEAQAQSVYFEQRSLEARHREITAQQHALNVERQAKEDLERKVAEQTSELQLAMYSLTQANTELEKMSQTDGLTHLANRRYFDHRFTEEFDLAMTEQWPIAVLIMDIDFFKKVNDHYGHQAGDQCLRDISAIFPQFTESPHDLCARYGGEEFCLVLPNRTEAETLNIAEGIRTAVADKAIHYGDQTFHVTISIGFSVAVPATSEQRDIFLKRADEALYFSKHNGRNQVTQI
ncbi:Phytochrome-like protein cph2 [Marinomonas aquimarina]|uniref:diguanylate cyclase n=1 Tax=Marinomonas aquimarina TaxID=295068 RepID=A0A1A8TIP6_9GAMM|nr:diguanylate cyclase [Marinomonas aquimarina]SBS32641.1 Phytochrome-like protein cph2 [Marinomonas aquimarina]